MPLVVTGFLLEGSPFAFRWTPRAMLSVLYLALVGTAMILGGVFLGVRRPAKITSRSRPPSTAS